VIACRETAPMWTGERRLGRKGDLRNRRGTEKGTPQQRRAKGRKKKSAAPGWGGVTRVGRSQGKGKRQIANARAPQKNTEWEPFASRREEKGGLLSHSRSKGVFKTLLHQERLSMLFTERAMTLGRITGKETRLVEGSFEKRERRIPLQK